MYMKKTILYVLAYCCIADISAQDTVRYGDPWYLFNEQPNVSVFDYYPPAWNPSVQGSPSYGASIMLQQYLIPSNGENTPAYGIALTCRDAEADSLKHKVGIYSLAERKGSQQTWDGITHYAAFEEIASLSMEDAVVKQCKFGYWDGSGGEFFTTCFELYFDQPVPVSDTFYIGIRTPEGGLSSINGLACGYDTSHSQTWWWGSSPDTMLTITSASSPQQRVYKSLWGVAFPIVRPRCTAPREGEVIRVEGDSVVIQFVDDGEEHQYEVVYARDGFGVDTTAGERTAAPDSLFTFRGLEAGMRYWYRVRRSCTIGNMTVWSPWSPGYRLPATVGIRPDMEPVALEVKPNPANEYVEVTAEVPEGSLELRDAQGRLHLSQRLEGGHARIELQGVPAGVYTLHLRSAEGNATRRVIVR